MTLKHFLHEFGITTYEGMLTRCERMGVTPPDEGEFKVCFPSELPLVNNPLEGIVVIEPLVIDEEETEAEAHTMLRSGFIELNDLRTTKESTSPNLDEPFKRSKKKGLRLKHD